MLSGKNSYREAIAGLAQGRAPLNTDLIAEPSPQKTQFMDHLTLLILCVILVYA